MMKKKHNVFVIGCGDVVIKRLYPALQKHEQIKDILIYDTEKKSDICTFCGSQSEICEDVKKKATKKDIIWIATPSFSHVDYLKSFIDLDVKLIVVEKPIAINKQELEYVESLVNVPEKRNKIFFLSYYILEKALPLYYMLYKNHNYEKYMNVTELDNINSILGKLETIDVYLCEGKDNRNWVTKQNNHAQLFETFIHNVLVATLVCGQPTKWNVTHFQNANYQKTVHEIALEANCEQTKIYLCMQKNVKQENIKRYAQLNFEKGVVNINFDTQIATITDKFNKKGNVFVYEHFKQKYSIMVDLVFRVCNGECSSSEVDGLINQIESLQWLLTLDQSEYPTKT